VSTDARIDLTLDGERLRWTPAAGFRGSSDRAKRLARDLGRMIRPEDKPAHEPSLTRWVERQLRELDVPELELDRVRLDPADGAVPAGAIA
jgi:hypothetical protein